MRDNERIVANKSPKSAHKRFFGAKSETNRHAAKYWQLIQSIKYKGIYL